MAKNCKLQIANCKLIIAESSTTRTAKLRCLAIYYLHFAICILQWFLIVLLLGPDFASADERSAGTTTAKPPAKQKLLERRPFDEVILTKAAGGATLEVQPITLPQRPLTELPKTGSLKVRVLDRPTEDFEIGWGSVAQVRVFEQLLVDEGLRLAAAGKFDEAYDYFARMRAEYPKFTGLDDATSEYLERNAVALYRARQYDRALALLLSLYQRNPAYASLPSNLEAVAGEIIQRYLREGNYVAARHV